MMMYSMLTQEKPYVMVKQKDYSLVGNARYEGFCIDLLSEIAEMINFQYEIHLVPDTNYGAPIKNSDDWSGMVGEVLQGVRLPLTTYCSIVAAL